MIKIITLLFALSGVAAAGPGAPGHSHNHDHATHEITKDEAQKAGAIVISKLIEKNKINASWANANPVSVEKKEFKKGKEWVVAFNNPNESDASKKTLYVFLSTHGDYIAANFTGN